MGIGRKFNNETKCKRIYSGRRGRYWRIMVRPKP